MKAKLEFSVVIFIILLFVFFNSLIFITGILNTPDGHIYLGTVHWPSDYFYYLSQFAQGQESWFLSYDLYSHNFADKTLVGWVNVFLGRIGSFFGISQIITYQLSIVIFAILYLWFSFLLIREIFPKERSDRLKRMVAFILFVTSNAFPIITYDGGNFTISYYDYWFNNGIPFNRLGGVPHHLIARFTISLGLLLLIWWFKKDKLKILNRRLQLLVFMVLGFVLGSIDPVHWLIVASVMFLVTILIILFNKIGKGSVLKVRIPRYFTKEYNNVSTKRSKKTQRLRSKSTLTMFLPSMAFFLGGFSMVVYLKKLFTNLPYSQLVLWEASAQLSINIRNFIFGNGPVAVLSIFGLILFLRKFIISRFIAVVFSLISLGLFFSPIGRIISIGNVRFLPATVTIFLASFTAEIIDFIAGKIWKEKMQMVVFLTGIILLILAPSLYAQINKRLQPPNKNSSLVYVSNEVWNTFKKARSISKREDIFLIHYPFNWSFPAITSRREYHGHNLLTINYAQKEKEATDFYFRDTTVEQKKNFLINNNISYVMGYSELDVYKNISILTQVYDNGRLAIYKVNRPSGVLE